MTDHHYQQSVDWCDEVTQVSLFLGVVCAVIMGVSRRAGDLIMGLVSLLLHSAFQNNNGNLSSRHEQTMAQIPRTISAALSRFNLDGKVTTYAVCPTCHCTYKLEYKPGSTLVKYPEWCTNHPTPNSGQCNEPLLHEKTTDDTSEREPLKWFVYHDFQDYLAGLLSRPDIEQIMDQACDDAMDATKRPPPQFISNIFQADFLRSFQGPGSTPDKPVLFICQEGEGCYVFTLNIDFFNPEGLNPRGATASCGVITMACMNLGLDLCYKPENLYLAGIIPGPVEPHGTDLNHYLHPLVDNMKIAWERGVYFSHTALFPDGRLSRSAIAAVICDFPAARKTAALAGIGSHFYCSVCQCWHLSSLGNTDCEKWKKRKCEQLRRDAIRWKEANTVKDQETIFSEAGVRWSELWRLTYWDPTRQLVVDSMHCVLERIVQHLVREVLILTTKSASSKAPITPAFPQKFATVDPDDTSMSEKERKQVAKIHKLLVAPIDEANTFEILADRLYKSINQRPLEFVCQDLSCVPAQETLDIVGRSGRITLHSRICKIDYAKALVDWVSYNIMCGVRTDLRQRHTKPREIQCDGPLPLKITTPDGMRHIRDVIKNTVTPSWLGSVPHNFGDAAAGALKADEWRTLATVYLPIALVSLWGEGTSHSSPELTERLRQIVDHSMLLFSAVCLVCM